MFHAWYPYPDVQLHGKQPFTVNYTEQKKNSMQLDGGGHSEATLGKLSLFCIQRDQSDSLLAEFTASFWCDG